MNDPELAREFVEKTRRWNTVTRWLQWDIINRLIEATGYQTYLEIGIKEGECHEKVQAAHKVGVDPAPLCEVTHKMTSDEFFAQNEDTFDLIFVDGDHRWQQVIRDVDNALKVLAPGGAILMHDCVACVKKCSTPIKTPDVWWGTVWKALCMFRMLRADVSMWTIDCVMGIGVVRPGCQELYRMPPDKELTYEYYWNHLPEITNLLSVEDFFSSIVPTFGGLPEPGNGPDC